MKNRDFLDLLHAEGYNIQKVADGIYSGYAHVNQVLLNRTVHNPNLGLRTRVKLVKFIKEKFKTHPAMLAALGWDEAGNVRQRTFPVEHPAASGGEK
jgi:hypothetical protein